MSQETAAPRKAGRTAARTGSTRKTRKKNSRRRIRVAAAMERTTTRVEKLHRAVAGFPLDVLERVRGLEEPVARVRKLQERSITATYDLFLGINAELTRLPRTPPRA